MDDANAAAAGKQMLSDVDLPPLFHAADSSSLEAQRYFLRATKIRLWGLILAALFGLFEWKFFGPPVDFAGVFAAVAFCFVLAAEAYLLQAKPERTWYEGRAAAESVKTLSWRYAVGGAPFNIAVETESAVKNLYLERLRSLFDVVKDLDLVAPTSSQEQLTEPMRKARSLSLDERKKIYEIDRVQNQQDWYQSKARIHKQSANLWTMALIGFEFVGVIFGILKAIGVCEMDILTFSGVLVGAVATWLQAKQFRTLATAYTVTALELASIRSKIKDQLDEASWATFVDNAEEAFSREHTLWKASHVDRPVQ